MIVDTHCHLDVREFDGEHSAVIERAKARGVEEIITVGVDLESSQKALSLSEKYEGVFAAVGIQPEEIGQYFDGGQLKTDLRTELERLAKNKKVVAVGECGLDYKEISKIKDQKSKLSAIEKQKDVFRRQLGLAVLLDLPVIIHNREADEDTLREIDYYHQTRRLRGVFHCFTSAEIFARKITDRGFLISLAGIITYPNAETLRRVVREVPLEKIVVETDSPFLAPQSQRGWRNEPAWVTEVINELANIKRISPAEAASATTQNARKLFHRDR